MSNPIAGIRIVVDTGDSPKKLKDLQALGQATAAEIEQQRLAIAHRRERVDAEAAGLSAAEQARLQYIQGLEAEAVAVAAAAAAQEQARRGQAFTEELEGRRRVATDDPAAEAYRRALEQEREVQAAVAQGIDAAGIAQLRYIQQLEDEKAARDALNAQQERALELLRQETRAQEDLNVRKLRARGLDAAADDLALLSRQAQEREDAQRSGFSASFLTDLIATQALERQRLDQERRRQQAEAFARSADQTFGLSSPFPTSQPSVNLAVGVSESGANRLSGLSGSMLAVQQQYLPLLQALPRMASRLERIEALLARQLGVSAEDLAALLGREIDQAETNVGIVPRSGG